MTADQLGEIAYNAYCDTRDWKSFNNEPLPKWPDVKPEIKAGWVAAASAVATRIRMDANPHEHDPAKEGGN